VVAKDLRYIFRSAVGKYNFIAVPVLIVGIGLIFRSDVKPVVLGMRAENVLFPVIVFYTSLFTNNIVLNAFAWESGGIQLYCLSPVPLRKVLPANTSPTGPTRRCSRCARWRPRSLTGARARCSW